MSKDNKVRMPSSMAGITQYFDAGTSNFVMTPRQVLVIIALVTLGILAMHAFVPV